MKKDEIRNARNFEELLDLKYGKLGDKDRDEFEKELNILWLARF